MHVKMVNFVRIFRHLDHKGQSVWGSLPIKGIVPVERAGGSDAIEAALGAPMQDGLELLVVRKHGDHAVPDAPLRPNIVIILTDDLGFVVAKPRRSANP